MQILTDIINALNSYSDTITAISAVIVAVLALFGLREWKLQTKGKTNYEIARRYLKAALRLRDELKYVRNPFIPLSETNDALKESGIESKDHLDENRAVYSRRWKRVQEAWTNLEIELLDAEVSWGNIAVSASKPLLDATKKLFAALTMYLDGQGRDDKLIYNHGSLEKPDEFSGQVDQAIEQIRDFLRPHLL